MIKLFMNREQMRLLNSKTGTIPKPYEKLKYLVCDLDLLFTTFVKNPPDHSR